MYNITNYSKYLRSVFLVCNTTLYGVEIDQRHHYYHVSFNSLRYSHSFMLLIIFSVLMSVMTIVMSIGSVAGPITAASQAAGAASILFTIIDAPRPQTTGLKGSSISFEDDIVLQNVNFAYPVRHDVKVLDDVSVRFPAGKVTALVGASGCGKSTIVGLLERWYELDGNLTDNSLVSISLLCYQTVSLISTVEDFVLPFREHNNR